MKNNLIYISLLCFIFIISCKKDPEYEASNGINYRQEMRDFVQNISAHAKSIHPDFAIVPQNGVQLVSINDDEAGLPDQNYLNAIDGIGQEDLNYGYKKDNQETPRADNTWLRSFLDLAKNNGNLQILITDYCSTPSKMDNSYNLNHNNRYVSFAADHRDLDNIPAYPSRVYSENSDSVANLLQAKNFLYLINPDNQFSSKKEFIDAVKKTNYDLIIMDLFFDGSAFTASQIEELKRKSNGAKRMVICYMSIGEAEDYRYYWQKNWKVDSPEFIYKKNPDWAGNFVVEYWNPEWQKIIFGNNNSYLSKIMDAGFDGVYLDVIDAFELFEK
ncbi:MAG: hypothetical protein GC181_14000 [Bacteroidetes bacterium]|nr:hypothetical protein [Bacteroidota bacterium]